MEEAVLGALLVDQEAYALVAEILKPESFYDKRNQLIFKAIQELNVAQRPVDIMTLQEHLEHNGELEEAGGLPYIMQINMKIGSSAHIEYHAKVIAQKALARQLITFSSYIQTYAYDPTVDVKDLMQEAEAQLFAISQQNMKKDYTQIDPVMAQVFKSINQAAAQKDGMSGIPTGFEKLDKITNGWQKSDLIIIAARPSMGKTAFALSMVKRMAVDYRIPVAVFSLEMSNQQLGLRLLVNVTEISGEKLRSGQLLPHEWEQLDMRSRQLAGAPIFLDDTPQLTNFELRTKARRLVREHNVKAIIIDYLQLMHAKGLNINSRQEEVAAVSQSLKGLAKELGNAANQVVAACSQRPELSGVRTSYATNTPSVAYMVDREKIKNLGIELSDVFTALQTNFGGSSVNDFTQFGRSYKVIVQADTSYRSQADSLKFISVKSSSGKMVPLDTLLTSSMTTGPSSITRFNGVRSVTIQGSAASGYSSGEAMAAAEEAAKSVMPTGMTIEWSGKSREESTSSSSTTKILIMALVFAFLCLAALYESWSMPFAVLFTVPTGIFGAVGSEYIIRQLASLFNANASGFLNSVYMQIGVIMIIGLAAKNAILIVEFAKERVDKGIDPMEAVVIASKLRLRPILMTAFTAIIGCLPLAFASGAGAGARCGMGVAVVGGMTFATLCGLLLIPANISPILKPRKKHHANSR